MAKTFKDAFLLVGKNYCKTNKHSGVILTTIGNPDYNQDPTRPLFNLPNSILKVQTYNDAVEAVKTYIELNTLGSSNWNGGEIINSKGEIVAYISYNGRVWDGEYSLGKTPNEITDIKKDIL